MLGTIITRSFLNQRKAMAVMIASVAVGAALTATLLALSFDISSKISKELRLFGANIVIQPKISGLAGLSGQERYLREQDLPKAKTIFWRHNIQGIAPVLVIHDETLNVNLLGTWYRHTLPLPGEKSGFEAGVASVMPWWSVEGAWPSENDEVLAGAGVAQRLEKKIGDPVTLRGRGFRISGIVTTGGKEDDMFVADLGAVQKTAGLEGKVSRVFVSALATPMDEFAYKDPNAMTKNEYERWYCTGYVTSIARQLEEAFQGSTARPIWPVAETEGKVLGRLNLLIYLLSAVCLLAAALGVSTTMVVSLLRRTDEVALMKAIGADGFKTGVIFFAEALMIGLAGGVMGYLLSLCISDYVGLTVFGTALVQKAMLLPISLAVSVFISVLGVFLPVRRALKIKPALALKGGQ